MVISRIFAMMVSASFVFSLFNGSLSQLSEAILVGAQSAVELAFSMLGMTCLWSGIIKVLEASGITKIITRIAMPFLKLIYPDSRKNGMAMGAVSANFAANLLGLGNAALPLGLYAIKELSGPCDRMTFAALSTVPIQLFPATLITLRKAAGSTSPYSIILPIWAVSIATYIFAVLICRLCAIIYKRRKHR